MGSVCSYISGGIRASSELGFSEMTAEEKPEVATLAAAPDDSIDYSDIPPLTEAFEGEQLGILSMREGCPI